MRSPMEEEANAFAMELLMPREWLQKDIEGLDIDDEKKVARLAKKYGVSNQVLCFRIGELRTTDRELLPRNEL